MPEPGPRPRDVERRKVARVALLAGLALFVLKLAVFALTNSAAVLSDALESIVNIAAAGVMLYTLHLASRPPDKEHLYGHGKAEFLAVAFEGAMVLFAAAFIAVEAVSRLFNPVELSRLNFGVWALGAIALLSGGLAAYIYKAGRRTDSPILIADARHLFTDVLSTLAGLAALVLVNWSGRTWIDPLAALLLAAAILYTGLTLLGESISHLMDRSDPEDDRRIRAILDKSVEGGLITGYHKLRHRRAGAFAWIDMHIQVPNKLDVRQAHDLATDIEREIERTCAPANATAHVEPADHVQQV